MTHLSGLTFRPAQDADRAQFINLARLAFSPMRSLHTASHGFANPMTLAPVQKSKIQN
ncbi:MAG: hypothetical protein HC866_01640 [Leptolyngbyaceae cyanobacterium RU_5_1]|nr:hypothetical protein [Leptolyngbyaceae cyanobacterium RU_5_1]